MDLVEIYGFHVGKYTSPMLWGVENLHALEPMTYVLLVDFLGCWDAGVQ